VVSLVHSVVFCCTAGFLHSFSVSSSLSVLSCQFECKYGHHYIIENLVHKPCCWFTSHSAFITFIPKKVVSQMSNPSMFPLPNRVQYLPVFSYFTFLRTSSLVTLLSRLIYCISTSAFQRRLLFCLSASTSMSLLRTVLNSRPSISLFSSLVSYLFYQ